MSLYLVHIILILIVVTSFHLHIRNANEVIWQFWDGKFSIRHSRHIPIPVLVTIFPHSWLSSCGKKKILHSRLRRSWRIFFSPRLLSHSWGKIVTCTGIGMCLSWLIENFKIPPLAASPLVEEFSRPKIAKWLHWYISSRMPCGRKWFFPPSWWFDKFFRQ